MGQGAARTGAQGRHGVNLRQSLAGAGSVRPPSSGGSNAPRRATVAAAPSLSTACAQRACVRSRPCGASRPPPRWTPAAPCRRRWPPCQHSPAPLQFQATARHRQNEVEDQADNERGDARQFDVADPHGALEPPALHLESECLTLQRVGLVHQQLDLVTAIEHLRGAWGIERQRTSKTARRQLFGVSDP